VYLAGEFNDWQPKDLRLEGPDEKGHFAKRLELRAGSYQYKFVINGTEWEADPQNMYKFGTDGNSVVWVGPRK
jgi:1,4-alpha-glucan branching enzyme